MTLDRNANLTCCVKKVTDLRSILVDIAMLLRFHAAQKRGHLDQAFHATFVYLNGGCQLTLFLMRQTCTCIQ
jgi:hypothetical protein